MFNGFGPTHLLIVFLVFAVLFGAKRLPDAARGIGRSLRVFKAEMAAQDVEKEHVGPPATTRQATPAPAQWASAQRVDSHSQQPLAVPQPGTSTLP